MLTFHRLRPLSSWQVHISSGRTRRRTSRSRLCLTVSVCGPWIRLRIPISRIWNVWRCISSNETSQWRRNYTRLLGAWKTYLTSAPSPGERLSTMCCKLLRTEPIVLERLPSHCWRTGFGFALNLLWEPALGPTVWPFFFIFCFTISSRQLFPFGMDVYWPEIWRGLLVLGWTLLRFAFMDTTLHIINAFSFYLKQVFKTPIAEIFRSASSSSHNLLTPELVIYDPNESSAKTYDLSHKPHHHTSHTFHLLREPKKYSHHLRLSQINITTSPAPKTSRITNNEFP